MTTFHQCLGWDSHQPRPVSYASKSLSEAEQNYANVEHELLGTVFAIETFKHFTYGRLTNIITDHKPVY